MPEVITQSELRAVCELYDLAHDLAIAIRARMEAGMAVERGTYRAQLTNVGYDLKKERRLRRQCGSTDLVGLCINYGDAQFRSDVTLKQRKKARHAA